MNYSKILFALICAFCVSTKTVEAQPQKSTTKKLELNQNWSFKAHHPEQEIVTIIPKVNQWMIASVPGVVQTDLLANKVISDPFFGENERKNQWVGDQEWHYQTIFETTPEFMAEQNIELVFKGLDTYAQVYLNEELILTTDNMFVEWRVDVKTKILNGPNTLLVKFLPTYKTGVEVRKKHNYPFILPADNDKGNIKTSVFTRKAPYHFGWDWAPRYLTVGVWKPAYLEAWSWARLNNVRFEQKTQTQQAANFVANVNVNASRPGNVWVRIVDQNNTQYYNKEVKVQFGQNQILAPMTIRNPKLWWPNGTGEQNLYPTKVIISRTNGGEPLDTYQTEIGVRTIELVQTPDANGKSFYFEVNGEPVFAKGANYIPQDVFLPRVSRKDYKEFIDMCVESNFNMLRVWGGGVYQDDYFYELCDKAGIMVWQDFMFSCSLYPWSKEFLDNVENEVRYNVRRLANHPSIAVWCGNNEITELWNHWGYQRKYAWNRAQQAQILAGMEKLFYQHIPTILAEEDPTRYYHRSSPTHGRGNAKSQQEGDSHYWGVFHDGEPFSTYAEKTGRFNSEYGFQSMACYDTYRESFDYLDLNLNSAAVKLHQKNPRGQQIMETYMARDLPVETDDFRKFVYLSQLLQAEGMKIAMDAHRQNRPKTMGSLYWQANDCWPAASWSSMDSKRRWKAFQFYAKESFKPTNISFAKVDSTAIQLWGVTDELKEKNGKLSLSLIDFKGSIIKTEPSSFSIPRNSSKKIVEKNIKQLLGGHQPNKVALVAVAQIDGKMYQAIHYFVPFKDLDLPIANYDVKYEMVNDQTVKATIRAKALLKNVLFEARELQNNPSDAYFDLLPGETKEVILTFVKPFENVATLGIKPTTLNSFIAKGELPVEEVKLSKKQQAEADKKLTYEQKVQLAKNIEKERTENIKKEAVRRTEETKEQTIKDAQDLNTELEKTIEGMKTSLKEQLEMLKDQEQEKEKIKTQIKKEMDAVEKNTEKAILKLQTNETKQLENIQKQEVKLLEKSKVDLQKQLEKLAAEKVKADEKAHKELIQQKIKAKKEREAAAAKKAEEEEKARIKALKDASRR